jgi:hypothetical protein
MKTPVIYNMATIPSREKALQECLASILPQADIINLYFNGWNGNIPHFARHPKIRIFESEKEYGDLGDVGKFFLCEEWNNAYIFTTDDKIIYPGNHTKVMIETIEKYNRKAVISNHGRIFHTDRPCKTYYWDCKEFLGCLATVSSDRFVHEIGTGVMAFHTDTFKPTLEMFPRANMTDIYISIELNKLGIPRVVRAHREYDYRISRNWPHAHSISQTLNKNDKIQTDTINNVQWEIHSL